MYIYISNMTLSFIYTQRYYLLYTLSYRQRTDGDHLYDETDLLRKNKKRNHLLTYKYASPYPKTTLELSLPLEASDPDLDSSDSNTSASDSDPASKPVVASDLDRAFSISPVEDTIPVFASFFSWRLSSNCFLSPSLNFIFLVKLWISNTFIALLLYGRLFVSLTAYFGTDPDLSFGVHSPVTKIYTMLVQFHSPPTGAQSRSVLCASKVTKRIHC